jgi:hypothetical protein
VSAFVQLGLKVAQSAIGPLFNVIAHRNQKLSCFEVHQQNFKKSIFDFSEVLHHYQQPIGSVVSAI